MSLIHRLVLCLFFAAALPVPALAAPTFDSTTGRAELDAIEKLSETSVLEALRRLEALSANLAPDTSYEFRRDLLQEEVWMREDAGQLDASYAADQKRMELARANNDPSTVVVASMHKVRRLLDLNQVEQARAAMERIMAQLPAAPSRLLDVALETVQGDIYNAEARYDRAIASYLKALKLEEQNPDAGEGRANLGIRIAQIHINADHPAKAVEAMEHALREKNLPVRTSARLQSTLGIALLRLNRNEEALLVFDKVLQAAKDSAMTGLEATVRGNIADYYLRQHDYVRAAEEARLALEASLKVKNENLIVMAKANLGFGLMGQGKIAEGLPFIDGVIAELTKAGANADLDAMYDEKGRMQERAGLYKDALATVRLQQSVQQTGAREARDKAIASLQEQYAANQRTREIELLRRENGLKDADLQSRRMLQMVTSFAAVLTVLASVVVFVLYRRAARSNGKLHLLNKQLEYHSMRDALTGLHNRRSFSEKMKLRAQRSEADRRNDAPSSVDIVALLDIDHFKHINDRWGHGIGDAVLVEVAHRLTAAVRDSDLVLRWGGEEFLIFAPGADPEYINVLIGRVLAGIGGTPVDAGTCMVPVTMTAGVTSLPPGGTAGGDDDWERAIRLADWALYQGKAHGRNQARIVTGLAGPIETVLAKLDATPGSNGAGLVEMSCVRGPEQLAA